MADNPKQPYGDVPYADPGYQSDGKKRYPIDTEEHVRAAWSYINQADNAAKYSSEHVASIKGRIKAAAKKFNIDISEEQQAHAATAPRGALIRGVFPMELQAAGDGMPTLVGHFAVFDRWARIDSMMEGQFLESVAPGAFTKTIRENRHRMRSLFNHGLDPSIGKKPIGPVREIREDAEGGYYEVPMLDTAYNRELLPGLREGLYGSSFQFTVMKEHVNPRPLRSDHNPDAWPEKRVLEARMFEFGPCTFPAYEGADAGVRSLTDDFTVMRLASDPERVRRLLDRYAPPPDPLQGSAGDIDEHSPALSDPEAEETHSRREPQPSRWPSVSREEFLRIGKSEPGRFSFGR